MNPFEMVVLVVLLAIGGGVLKSWLAQRGAAPPDPAQAQRLTALEERVRALEARSALSATDA